MVKSKTVSTKMTRCSVLVIGLWLLQATAASAALPDWIEGWLFNADERSRTGREALAEGDAERAVDVLDTSLRLAPDDATAQYNAGTAHLEAGQPDAAGLLQQAAAASGAPDVASRAAYNLGNSLLAAEDLPAAINAYKQSLRANPDYQPAKFNLELAQRRLREQQQNQDQDQQQNQDQQDQDQQQDQQQDQDQEQQDQQDEQQQDEQQGDQGENQEDQEQQQDQEGEGESEDQQDQQEQQNQPPEGEQGPQGEQERPLPQFEDLPDMSAEEAAAILEAIENMEREQRQQDALEAARTNNRRKKDW